MSSEMPWSHVWPTRGRFTMCSPASAPATPAIQVLGAPMKRPSSNSSGYSPRFQTLPSLSWAKNASSVSDSSPSFTSTSHTTRERTPAITFVRSVTVNVTVCGSGPPPRLARPSRVSRVPGTSGSHRLSITCSPGKAFGRNSTGRVHVDIPGTPDATVAPAPTATAPAQTTTSETAHALMSRPSVLRARTGLRPTKRRSL